MEYLLLIICILYVIGCYLLDTNYGNIEKKLLEDEDFTIERVNAVKKYFIDFDKAKILLAFTVLLWLIFR